MRKGLLICLTIVLAFSFIPPCHGETQLYSIRQLPDVTAPTWQQTYQAYGRTIEVDQPIIIPDAETAPVLSVRVMPPIAEPQYSEMAARFAQPKGEWKGYSFWSNDYYTYWSQANPGVVNERAKENQMDITYTQETVLAWDMSVAYAENNPLTLAEAWHVVREQLQEVYPEEDFTLRHVGHYTRWKSKKSGKYLRETGSYMLECAQVFHGIPYMGSVLNTFAQQGLHDEFGRADHHGRVDATIYDEGAFNIACRLLDEQEVLCEDIPLLPFDAVKPLVEEQILDGYVRAVYSVTLGYVQFCTSDPDVYTLMPAWVVWCQYANNGPRQEDFDPGVHMAEFLFREMNIYKPLILNAQTGELIDPQREDLERSQCPTIITW